MDTATVSGPANQVDPASQPPRGRFWPWVLLALAGWLGYVLSLEWRNPRLVASWHGFLHSAIVTRFPSPGWIPENPFFAGEPLRYYWVFHRISAGLGSLAGTDPLTAMRVLTLTGLVILVLSAAVLGRRRLGSTGAGILIGTLALAGMNPLGPVIAAGRHVAHQLPLIEEEPGPGTVETMFVTNAQADRLMSRNLLPAMYFSTDWRHGQNIPWFFDISSRGLSLGVLMLLLALVAGGAAEPVRVVTIGLATALLTALNPIVGLAVAGSLGLALIVVTRRVPAMAIALAAGVVVAAPTFYQLLGAGGGASLNPPGVIGLKLVNMGVNFLVLVPLSLLLLRVRGTQWQAWRALVLAAGVLLVGVALVHLEEGNEHNLTNAAQVVLAVTAVAGILLDREGRIRTRQETGWRLWAVGLLFLPVTAGTWIAFDGRPPLPLATRGHLLRRTDAPLSTLYRWIRETTAPDAVFVVNPDQPVKMSGNVSELPAFTGRTLFTDQPSYLTTPYRDAALRASLAGRLVEGEPASPDERDYLERLGRPLFVITWHADRPELTDRLASRYGPALFHQQNVAVFAWR